MGRPPIKTAPMTITERLARSREKFAAQGHVFMTIRLDRPTVEALAKLTADGSSKTEAIAAAIRKAAKRLP
jgi:hypothetical protein